MRQHAGAGPKVGRPAPLHAESLPRYVLAIFAVAIVGAASCDPYLCTYETRFIATQPDRTVAEAGSFAGYVTFRDYSNGEPGPADITWAIEMTGAVALPTRLLLSDVRDTTRVFVVLPIGQTQGRISASAVAVASRMDRDRVFEVLASGNGVLMLSLSDLSVPVLIPLRVTDREDWHRPNCS